MSLRRLVLALGCVCLLSCDITPANASVIISEFLADPPTGLSGDANQDGIGSTSQDEFIELLNTSSQAVNLSGWTLSDRTATRHVFADDYFLSPSNYVVVFSGGTPNIDQVDSVIASLSALGLNNTGDTITLKDRHGQVIDQVVYGREGGRDQSLSRFPEEPTSAFILHSAIAEANGDLFSPGRGIVTQTASLPDDPFDDDPFDPTDDLGTSAVPELPPYIYLMMGFVPLWWSKQRLSFARR